MRLLYGDTKTLSGKPWYMAEVRSEKTAEGTMKRIGKMVPGIFRTDALEIFVPIAKRGLDVFELKTGPYFFVRSTSFKNLLRLKQVTGVVGLVTLGDSGRATQAMKAEDSYVQSLITEARETHAHSPDGIEVGSFVRLLGGQTRDFCGIVQTLDTDRAVVRIALKTKVIVVETPLRNLLLVNTSPDKRVSYYCPLVEDLDDTSLIAEDLKFIEPPPVVQEEIPTNKGARERTVTRFVKRLIQVDELTDPMLIARFVMEAIRMKEIKVPKNLFIVYSIIKSALLQYHYRRAEPEMNTWRKITKKYGKFSVPMMRAACPNTGIPMFTTEKCLDGRSREAREAKRFKNNKKR